jgi:hypothetical protein
LVNEALELGRAYGAVERNAARFAMAVVKPRPWMVPAYDGRELAARPARIGPRI